jgi:CO/xanthine dehydrogenase FAD-binding subunit
LLVDDLTPITDWQRPLRDAALLRPRTVEEAVALLGARGDARVLAGGTHLIRFARWGGDVGGDLVWIGGIEGLDAVSQSDGTLTIGPLAVHATLEASPLVAAHAPLLTAAAREIAGPAVRNLATVGGNLVINWDLAAPCLALDARLRLRSQAGAREVPLSDFYGPGGEPVALRRDELIESIALDTSLPTWGYQKVARRNGVSRAITAAAVVADVDGDTCRDVRIAVGGVGLPARRLTEVERLVRGQALTDELLQEAGRLACAAAADAVDDFEADAWYTQQMAGVTTERALNEAAGRPVI